MLNRRLDKVGSGRLKVDLCRIFTQARLNIFCNFLSIGDIERIRPVGAWGEYWKTA